MKVSFKILRSQPNQSAHLETYTLEVEKGNTILDCLNRIKWEVDGSLTFRKNCRNTICGSCAMKINGRSALACKQNVGYELEHFPQFSAEKLPEIAIAPLGNLPVVKDLVVDMQEFWDNLEKVEPYISTQARRLEEREFLQSPEEREKLNQMGNCIMCGACYSECNAREVNPAFVGPHALAKAWRWLADSRDGENQARLAAYNQGLGGVWGCTRCYMCNAVCPMEVEPMEQIGKIKQAILAQDNLPESRSIRHRRVLIELVEAGGWIDERKFGLYVVGNYFRDLQGLASLLPLGLRMLATGKFPRGFEPSEGTEQVRSLIQAVRE
jgi:succinate dehydrogenase / fumarate reductase iron-sulfur subunit